jgi:hypothetical protein
MADLALTKIFAPAYHADSQRLAFGEDIPLCENGNLVFHWADFNETCAQLKTAIDTDPEIREEYNLKLAGLNSLRSNPVWIKTSSKVHQTTMYDLYHAFILNPTTVSFSSDPFGPLEISFISSSGPFKSLSVTQCFNKQIYKDFVMINLLEGGLPRRDFRVRSNCKILLEYGANYQEAALIQLEQFTTHGLLLSIDREIYQKFSPNGSIRLLLDTTPLQQAVGLEIKEMRSHFSPYAFNLLYSARKEDALTCNISDISSGSSFEFLRTNRIHLFLSYDRLRGDTDSVAHVRSFVQHCRELMRQYFQTHLKKTA